jgi:hypothetical protein
VDAVDVRARASVSSSSDETLAERAAALLVIAAAPARFRSPRASLSARLDDD